MKRKVRCINIDGIEGFVKSCVTREMRKYLKSKGINFFDLSNTSDEKLSYQESLLKNNPNSLILKENSIISLYRNDILNGSTISSLSQTHQLVSNKEHKINHYCGGVYFLLLPEKIDQLSNGWLPAEPQDELKLRNCYDFLKNIKIYNISDSLDIKTVFYHENDKIFDIKDKIIQMLEKDYN